MKKKALAILIYTFILLAAAAFVQPLKVFAASGQVSFIVDESEVTVNQTFSVYLSVDADLAIGDFECLLYYDESKIQYRSGSDAVQGGDGYLKVSVRSATTASDNKKILMKFMARTPGKVVFTATNPRLYDFESGTPISVSATDAVVNIVASPDLSADSSLKSLKISPGYLTPVFSPDVFEYTATVGKEANNLYVSAIANDTNATVGIFGYEHLYPGENTVTILVTAENGSNSEYRIIITKLETSAPTATPIPTLSPAPTEAPLPEISEFDWKIEAFEEDGFLWLTGNYKFRFWDKPDSLSLPAGFVKTKLMISGREITVYSPDTTDVVNYVLICLRFADDPPALYKYDRVEKTISKFNAEDTVIKRDESDTLSEEVLNQLKSYQSTISLMGFIIAGLVAIWLLTCLGLLYLVRKLKGLDEFDD